MLIFRCLIPPLLLMLFSLLSCSSDSAYPYTVLKGDPYKTRIYSLPGGAKLYIARTTDRPRVAAALCMHSVASDTLDALYKESVYSPEYPLLFARIGSEVSSVADCSGSAIVCNNLPSNELENWATLMQGTFATLPDTLSIVLFGDVVYDDAVSVLSRYFAGASAANTDDAVPLLAHARENFYTLSGDDGRRLLLLSEARPDAKNSINLLASPPAKVLFPDTDNLKIKESAGRPKMVVAACNDSIFSFALRARLYELPASFLVSLKEYLDASFAAGIDSVASSARVTIEKNSHTVELSFSGRSESMQQSLAHTLDKWKSIADGEKFYNYLLVHKDAVAASKKDCENIALHSFDYTAGGERLCGLRKMAQYSMDALFSSSAEILFCGANTDAVYSLCLNYLNGAARPEKNDCSSVEDSLPRYLLLPADADSVATVTLAGSYASVEDFATMALFNKAAQLSGTASAAQFYPNGALLSVGVCVPFNRKAFEAAKSFMLYECSKYGSDALSLMAEYTATCERGYSSSRLYDALFELSFSDVEDFYNHHLKASCLQFIISRESSLNVHELTGRGRVVHLTYDELFGY